jgi:hypothetical protein
MGEKKNTQKTFSEMIEPQSSEEFKQFFEDQGRKSQERGQSGPQVQRISDSGSGDKNIPRSDQGNETTGGVAAPAAFRTPAIPQPETYGAKNIIKQFGFIEKQDVVTFGKNLPGGVRPSTYSHS